MDSAVAERNSLDRRRVQEAVLSRAIQDYEPRKSEWMAWCSKREFDDGSLVEEGKLLLFLHEVVEPRLHVNSGLQTRAVDELEEYVKTMEILWGLQKVDPRLASSITHHPRGPALSTYLDMHRRGVVELARDLVVDSNAERASYPPLPRPPGPPSLAKGKRKRIHLEPSLKETGIQCNLCKMRLGYASFKNHWERLHKKILQTSDPGIEWEASFHKKYATPLRGITTSDEMQTCVTELRAAVSSLIEVVNAIATHLDIAIAVQPLRTHAIAEDDQIGRDKSEDSNKDEENTEAPPVPSAHNKRPDSSWIEAMFTPSRPSDRQDPRVSLEAWIEDKFSRRPEKGGT